MAEVFEESKKKGVGTPFGQLPQEIRDRLERNAETLPYYHYRLHRTDVEPMMRADGDFILRKGTREDPEGYVLSVRWEGRVTHFQIRWIDGGVVFEDQPFSLIQNLVHHHHMNMQPVTVKSGAILCQARSRQNWELLESQVQLGKNLGKGAFGSVFQGQWTRPDKVVVTCAIKTLDTTSETAEGGKLMESARNEMLREARVMRELDGHPNVIREYGVTIDRTCPYAVMEFVDGGSLEKRLRSHDNPPSVKTKLKCCVDIARGLCYINRSGYVHRDVAARNVLFNGLENGDIGICKVSDFGLARKVDIKWEYKGPPDENIPVAWTAFEALKDGIWRMKSEVWAMGVLIWEIFSNGAKPYCDLEDLDKAGVMKFLNSGGRLKATETMEMPAGVERLMEECMFTDVQMRVPMSYVCTRLFDELVLFVKGSR